MLRPVPHNIQNRRTGPPSPRRTHPPSKHGKVCELHAEALTSSNQSTRIEWSIVLRYDEAGLDAVGGDGSQHRAKESHIGTQLEAPRIHIYSLWNMRDQGTRIDKQTKPRLGGDCRYAEPRRALCTKHLPSLPQGHKR